MANNLSVKIGANTADLEKSIERAKKTLEQYTQTAKQAKSQIESNVSVSNQQVNAYQRVVKQLEKVNSGTLATTQQQKVLSNQVKELKIQWNALTDDQRISGFGQSIANSLKAAESELETTKQKLASVSEQTKQTADTNETYSDSSFKLTDVLGKLGVAIGGAEAAQKLFTAAIASGNDTTDLYQNTLASLTGTFDQLLYSFVHFDFSAFNDGLATTISRFYQAADAADTLWNVMASFSVVQADANEKMSRAREILSDTNASQAERTKALALYREGVDDLQDGVNEATKSTLASINATISTGGKNVNLTMKTLGKLLEVQSTRHGENVRNMLKGDVDAARALVKAGFTVTADEAFALQQLYSKFSDEQLQDIISKYNQIRSMQSEVSRAMRMENRLTNRTTSTVRTPRASSQPRQRSLKDQISWGPSEIAKSLQIMKDYENERIKMAEEAAKKEEEMNQWLRDREDKAEEFQSKQRYKAMKQRIKEMNESKESIDKNIEATKSLGSAFSTMGQAIGGTSGQIISAMGQMMSQFPTMLQAIQTLTMAKEGEAIASGTAEGAKAPWFMQIAVIAGLVANIMSTFASIPKFANGGVFSGSSNIGDYNIARVNNGEMILNGRQQANLFRMLDAGNINTSTIAVQNPEVRIKGADIYLSQKNYKNISGRKI